jgi:RNA polymerase sigma-70 factor (TIGR02943 family)
MQAEHKEFDTIYGATVDPHQWVSRHADYLYTYAFTRLNDEEMARDLVQETFLAALEKVNQFKGNSTERTWLTAILKYKIIDIYRKKSSQIVLKPDIYDAEKQQQDFFDSESGHWNTAHRPRSFGVEDNDPLNNKEFARILQLCMKKLPELWLSVFTMKHMDDETTETICAALKVSQANFWVIIHRTKLNLRACLQKNWI